jgi:uncharacterized SAM-binding protein YcdF (DUF218 family)
MPGARVNRAPGFAFPETAMSLTRIQRFIAIALVAVAAAGFAGAGRMVVHEDALQTADAIYVLGGNWEQRWLEAADLYAEHYAPMIVLSRGTITAAERELQRRGVPYPASAELGRNALVQHLHIPATAVEVLSDSVDNTAQEAEAIRALAAARHWHKLIVITDRASTRRAGFAMRRVLGPGIDVIVRASRLDDFPANRWWRRRADFRTTFYEVPKLVAYWLGLKG